ncbi:C-C motif chemokine 20-like [Pristis pectinata]|uniref:C-C motif chemokine 20-like n=1 Tax=Pristis pectinata TaxID=685728 RepID=UPI00223E02E0|nr:C-C motif chemokine 20-like [Pristis pectinata]
MKQYLVVLVCLGVLTWVVLGAPNSRRKSCCLKYSNIVPRFKKIQGYEIQEKDGRCRINAVVFFVKSIRICSDPADEKVKKLVEILSRREKRSRE